MPFIASVSARQSGLLFANAAKLLAPLFGASSGAANGYTFSIWDMRDSVEYPLKNKDELQEYMNHPNYRFKITR